MIMAVNKCGDMVVDKQLVDRDSPSRPLLVEGPCAVDIVSAPLADRNSIRAASSVVLNAAGQVMRKDEFVLGCARFERPFQPLILLQAKRPIPAVA